MYVLNFGCLLFISVLIQSRETQPNNFIPEIGLSLYHFHQNYSSILVPYLQQYVLISSRINRLKILQFFQLNIYWIIIPFCENTCSCLPTIVPPSWLSLSSSFFLWFVRSPAAAIRKNYCILRYSQNYGSHYANSRQSTYSASAKHIQLGTGPVATKMGKNAFRVS